MAGRGVRGKRWQWWWWGWLERGLDEERGGEGRRECTNGGRLPMILQDKRVESVPGKGQNTTCLQRN